MRRAPESATFLPILREWRQARFSGARLALLTAVPRRELRYERLQNTPFKIGIWGECGGREGCSGFVEAEKWEEGLASPLRHFRSQA
jgi:hypothetical protein